MKKAICILLIVAMWLPLAGCNPTGTGEVRCRTEDYSILIRDGKWYLYLSKEMYSWCLEMHARRNRREDPLISPDGEVVGSKYSFDAPSASFSSVQQMREAFLTGDIPRTSLYEWSVEGQGYPASVRREFEMLNLDDLYVPVVPEGVSLKSIVVNSPCSFGMGLIITDRPGGKRHERESLGIRYHTKSSFEPDYVKQYELGFDLFKMEVEKGPIERTLYSEEIDPETGVHVVIGRRLNSQIAEPETYVRYALNANEPGYYVKKDGRIDDTPDGTVYVIEIYSDGEFKSLARVLVCIPCPTGGISVSFRNIYPKERNVEWLSQFGAIPLSEYEGAMGAAG